MCVILDYSWGTHVNSGRLIFGNTLYDSITILILTLGVKLVCHLYALSQYDATDTYLGGLGGSRFEKFRLYLTDVQHLVGRVPA